MPDTMELITPNWSEISQLLVRIAGAYALALPVGWERERSERTMGMRTFPLVAVASAAYILIGIEVVGVDGEAQARLIQGLMTGIGFIGGGAILKREKMVRGTATAAAVWATGAIGAASAYARLDIALLVSVITFATFRWMTPLKEAVEEEAGLDARRGR